MPSLMHRGRVLGDRTTYVGLDVTGTGSSWRSRKAACGARFETTAVSRTRRRLCTNNPAIRSARSCGRAAPRPTCQSAALATAPATLACRASPGTPLPVRGIEVNWRAGLASDPIDVNDDDQVTWLEALIWPGEPDRLANFRASLAIARRDPPRIIRGDLRADLVRLAAEAPRDATLVVFHTAVLAYVKSPEDRAAFARTVREIGAMWISNEAPGVVPEISAKVSRPCPPHHFLLSLNEEPIARTDLHGASIEWF